MPNKDVTNSSGFYLTFPPYNCDMPDLSELSNKVLFLWLKKWKVAGGPRI